MYIYIRILYLNLRILLKQQVYRDAEHEDNNHMYILVHLKNLFKGERMASAFSCVKNCELQLKAVQLGTGVKKIKSINDMMMNNDKSRYIVSNPFTLCKYIIVYLHL